MFNPALPFVGVPYERFLAASGCTVPFSNAHGPAAVYYADTNTTWIAWEASTPAGAGGLRHARVKTYNHTTNRWSAEYIAGFFGLIDDNHGQPSLCRDSDGYVHIFYGSHQTLIRCASTLVPNDPTTWRENATIAGTWTYTHPFLVGGVIYLFARDATTGTRMDLQLMKTTGIVAGVPTFGAAVSIIDLDADSRFYMGNGFVSGVNIHFVAARSDGADNSRQHVYYFVYETDTGDVRNFADSITIDVLDLPVDLTEANASFRLFAHTGGAVTNIPSVCLDSDSHPHVLFTDAADPGPYTLKHIWHNGSAWQAADLVGASMTNGIDSMAIYSMGSGRVAAVWPEDESSLWTFGGNVRKNEWVASAWGTPETILVAGSSVAIQSAVSVQDGAAGHFGIRAIFGETSGDPAAESGVLKVYPYGDGGLLSRPALIHRPVNTETTTLCDRFATPPTMERLALYDAMLTRLKDIGLSNFDAYYILAGADAQCIRQNLISNTYNVTANGGLTLTADRGVTGDGTTGFYGTGFVPSSAGGRWVQDSAHLAACTHIVNDNDSVIMGAPGAPGAFIQPRNASNQVSIRINTGTSAGVGNSDSSGFFLANRSGAAASQVDREGVQLTTTATASTGLPASELLLFSNATLFSNNRASIFHFGSSLGVPITGNRTKAYYAARFWNLSVGALA